MLISNVRSRRLVFVLAAIALAACGQQQAPDAPPLAPAPAAPGQSAASGNLLENPPPPTSPTIRAKVDLMLVKLKVDELMTSQFAGQGAQMEAQLRAQGQPARLAQLAREEANSIFNSLPARVAGVYAARLVDGEVDAVNAFLDTPVGQKMVNQQAPLMQELQTRQQVYQAPIMQRLQQMDRGQTPTTPAPTAKPVDPSLDPARVALARQLVSLQRKRDALETATLGAMRAMNAPANTITSVSNEFKPVWDGLINHLIEFHAINYSADELNELVGFYGSPAAQSFTGKELEITGTVMKDSIALGQKALQRAQERYAAESRGANP